MPRVSRADEVKIGPDELTALFDAHDALLDAVNVIRRDPTLHAWLAAHDPKALAQLDAAATLADPDAATWAAAAAWEARATFPPAVNLQGWSVLDTTLAQRSEVGPVTNRATYLRIPASLQEPISGGCSCNYCRQHPTLTPMWDTLGVPQDSGTTWTLHAPEWTVAR
jgi:hypothetical protein